MKGGILLSDKKKHHEKDDTELINKLTEKQKEASVVRKIVLVCFFVVVLSVIGVGAGTYFYVMSAIGPVDEDEEEHIEVTIPIGSTSAGIGDILEEEGLISNGTIFRYYVRYKNESGFQAGDYQLSPSMDMDEIILALKDGRVHEDYALSFTIPEGLWLEQIIEEIAKNTDYEYEELMDFVNDEDYLTSLVDEYSILDEEILENDNIRYPLEGYLFPARYDFTEENPEIEEIIDSMLSRTSSILASAEEQVSSSNYTIHELLAIASIIEGESLNDEERRIISGVIYNRLSTNMRLQMDPTIAYAKGEHLSRTMQDDLTVESPYNTYQNPGIPPGPINNPGQESIVAALDPESHDYLYFYHSQDGQSFFTETYAEHQEVLREHRDTE